MGIYELLHVTFKQRELISRKATADEIQKSAVEQGMITLRDDGIEKALAGQTTLKEVMRVAYSDEA